MTATVTELHQKPGHPSTAPKDPWKEALAALEKAHEAIVDDLQTQIETANEEAHSAFSSHEEIEVRLEMVGVQVLAQATLLHDRARHSGNLSLCLDPVCTAWADFIREQGWGA